MARTLDVSGLRCPMTWVRTKLELERMAPGEELHVRLPPGQAEADVPASARLAGHDVSVSGLDVRIRRAGA